MRTWGQSKILYSCICVWCESGKLGRRRSSRFPCVTVVVETFSSDRVTFRIPSNINDGAPLRKQSTTLTCRLFLQKSSTTDLRPDSKCGSDWRCYECGELVNWKCMEFVAASWCTKLSFDQTIKIRLLVMLIASAKPQSARGAYHQPAFMGSCLTISQMW